MRDAQGAAAAVAPSWQTRMKEDWNLRAVENAFYYIATDHKVWDVAAFFASGEDAVSRVCDSIYARHRLSPAQKTIVEVGCGIGRMSRAFGRRFGVVFGVDVSEVMIEKARELNGDLGNVHFLANDGSSLAAIADSSVDVCFSYLVFQHLPCREAVTGYIREFSRVLRPGGYAHFQVDGRRTLRIAGLPVPIGVARRVIPWLGAAYKGDPLVVGERSRSWIGVSLSQRDLERALAEAGLHPVELRGVGEYHMWCLAKKPVR